MIKKIKWNKINNVNKNNLFFTFHLPHILKEKKGAIWWEKKNGERGKVR